MMKKLVVVTGGTKGIGLALLNKFGAEGFDLAACARSKEDLDALKKSLAQKCPDAEVHVMPVDVSVKAEVFKFVDFIKKLGRPVEALINNAGVFLPGAVHQEEDGALEKTMATNLYSAYWLTRGLINDMKERRSGHIFNLCSTASIIPYVNGGSYCISKFALLGMTKVLREEMKEHNVKVTAVMPGATLTASWEGVDLPPERFMKPEDVAESIFSAYALSDRSVVEEILIRPQLGDI